MLWSSLRDIFLTSRNWQQGKNVLRPGCANKVKANWISKWAGEKKKQVTGVHLEG